MRPSWTGSACGSSSRKSWNATVCAWPGAHALQTRAGHLRRLHRTSQGKRLAVSSHVRLSRAGRFPKTHRIPDPNRAYAHRGRIRRGSPLAVQKPHKRAADSATAQTQWLQRLVGQHSKARSADEFTRLLKRQVYEDQLVVFGRAGLIARLSGGATVRDYLRRYPPDSSPELQVRVNGKPVSRDHRLYDGDSIEVQRSTA